MCGICGMAGEKVEESEILKRMMDKMHHRGPDGEGMYQSEHAALRLGFETGNFHHCFNSEAGMDEGNHSSL